MITGLLSTSNNKYDPPRRSKPKLIFLLNISSSNFTKFDRVKYEIINDIIKIKIIFIFEKYNIDLNVIF